MVISCANLSEKKEITMDKIKIEYAKKGTGGPAVIFEAGLGGGMDTWAPVFDRVAVFTTAFAYDRRGYGESGKPAWEPKTDVGDEIAMSVGEVLLDVVIPGASSVITAGTMVFRATDDATPRNGAVVTAELHEILNKVGVEPPYILVGHSLGGLYVSLYARLYPDEIAGLVWVDAMHPEQIERCKTYLPAKECDPEYYPWWVKTLIQVAPPVIRAEMSGMPETGRQIRSAGGLPAAPLVVISHGNPPADSSDRDRMWASLQEDLTRQSPFFTHVIASKSGHMIQKDEPELVVRSIQDMVMDFKEKTAGNN
jgi:pimeloyl-ACP methyl ester carboxylesterase